MDEPLEGLEAESASRRPRRETAAAAGPEGVLEAEERPRDADQLLEFVPYHPAEAELGVEGELEAEGRDAARRLHPPADRAGDVVDGALEAEEMAAPHPRRRRRRSTQV